MRNSLLSHLIVLGSVLGLAARAGAMTLVADGKPAATIVVRDEVFKAQPAVFQWGSATPITVDQRVRRAAEDLQRYIEKISGAKLPLVPESQPVTGPVILVGLSPRVAALKLDIPHGVTRDKKEEGYVIHARGNTLVLAGNEEGKYYGTYYAVAAFLHRLGVRWYMPGDFGEIVPVRKTIEIRNLHVRRQPDFALRTWWGYQTPAMYSQESLWKLRNGMQVEPLIETAGDSTIRAYMPDQELAKDHPEYFAKNAAGELDLAYPNLSNPDVPKLVAEKMKARIKQIKEQTGHLPESLGIAPDDGMPLDYRPESLKLNQGFPEIVGREGVISELSVSEEWFAFINQVAAEVAKEYPEVLLASNGYANRNTPPQGVKLHPNLTILYASIWADTLKALDSPRSWHSAVQAACIKRWTELNPRVHFYGYIYGMLGTMLTPIPTVRKLERDFPFYKKCGVWGFVDEQKPAVYMQHGIPTYYLRARLEWDADLNVRAVEDEFYAQWYGPAAKPARAYWDALEDAMQTAPILGHEYRIMPYVYTDELVKTLEQTQAQAEKLATTEPYATHVRVDRHILAHLQAYRAMIAAEFEGHYAEAIKHLDVMVAERQALHEINPFWHLLEVGEGLERYQSGTWGASSLLFAQRPYYQKLADMINGQTGRLVARGDRRVRFALDNADLGRFLEWYAPSFDRRQWLKVDTTEPYYLQVPGTYTTNGVPYRGAMWYVFDLDVPAAFRHKPVRLFAPAVVTEAWVWVNGQYIGHRGYLEPYTRPAELDFDVTAAVRSGKRNTVAVRVSTATNRSQEPDGFQGRLFLWSPNDAAPRGN
ncbi:DUF4838 domain-containing protein [bacterium]|nr:DUF4838 domain-containing protein [bacterium]